MIDECPTSLTGAIQGAGSATARVDDAHHDGAGPLVDVTVTVGGVDATAHLSPSEAAALRGQLDAAIDEADAEIGE